MPYKIDHEQSDIKDNTAGIRAEIAAFKTELRVLIIAGQIATHTLLFIALRLFGA